MDKCKNCGHDIVVYRHPLGYRPLVFHLENNEPYRTCGYPIKEDESGRTPCRCSNPQMIQVNK